MPSPVDRWTLVELPGTGEWFPAFLEEPPSRRSAFAAPKKYRGIYFLIRGPVVIWVGQTTDLTSRIRQHRWGGREFDFALFLEVPSLELDPIEMYWTHRLRPPEVSDRTRRMAEKYANNWLPKIMHLTTAGT